MFVVNIGNFISVHPGDLTLTCCADINVVKITNGLYKSIVHRALSSPQERLSIPSFFSINYDATVEVIASCVADENTAKYPPITAGKYVLERLRLALQDNE